MRAAGGVEGCRQRKVKSGKEEEGKRRERVGLSLMIQQSHFDEVGTKHINNQMQSTFIDKLVDTICILYTIHIQ